MMRTTPKGARGTTAALFVALAWWSPLEATPPLTAAEVLERVDGYRTPSDQYTLTITISDHDRGVLEDRAVFVGFFSGVDTSLVVCTEGRNRDMKVLMKGDHMWVNLPGSKRALRITPAQRLLGQAANGDVARVAFGADYEGEILARDAAGIRLGLHAVSSAATYQQIELVVDPVSFRPLQAKLFVGSGKHLKTALYGDTMGVDGHQIVRSVTIVDALRDDARTTIEYADFADATLPEKMFNVMYLPRLDLDLP
jgi:hypothetical protein